MEITVLFGTDRAREWKTDNLQRAIEAAKRATEASVYSGGKLVADVSKERGVVWDIDARVVFECELLGLDVEVVADNFERLCIAQGERAIAHERLNIIERCGAWASGDDILADTNWLDFPELVQDWFRRCTYEQLAYNFAAELTDLAGRFVDVEQWAYELEVCELDAACYRYVGSLPDIAVFDVNGRWEHDLSLEEVHSNAQLEHIAGSDVVCTDSYAGGSETAVGFGSSRSRLSYITTDMTDCGYAGVYSKDTVERILRAHRLCRKHGCKPATAVAWAFDFTRNP